MPKFASGPQPPKCNLSTASFNRFVGGGTIGPGTDGQFMTSVMSSLPVSSGYNTPSENDKMDKEWDKEIENIIRYHAEDLALIVFAQLGMGFRPEEYNDLFTILTALQEALHHIYKYTLRFGKEPTFVGYIIKKELAACGIFHVPMDTINPAKRLLNKLRYWEVVCGNQGTDLANLIRLLNFFFFIPKTLLSPDGLIVYGC